MVLRLISLVIQSSGIPSSLSAKRRIGEPPCRRTAVSANDRVGEPPSAKRRVGELSITRLKVRPIWMWPSLSVVELELSDMFYFVADMESYDRYGLWPK